MSPFAQALDVYSREPCVRSFSEDLEAHLRHGLVVSNSECFLMARKVFMGWNEADVVNPWVKASSVWHDPDCWHVYLFAGDIHKAFLSADVQLPWVSFERRNKIRYYPWDIIFKKTQRIFKS